MSHTLCWKQKDTNKQRSQNEVLAGPIMNEANIEQGKTYGSNSLKQAPKFEMI